MNILVVTVLLFIFRVCHAEPGIASFWLYDVDDGMPVRQMRSNTVISVPYNYTVVAYVSGEPYPDKVIFTLPFRKVERRAPYVLSGDWPPPTEENWKPNYKPLRLNQGVYSFSAYPDNKPEKSLTITNVSVYPPTGPGRLNGPLPTEIVPENGEDPITPPPKPKDCKHTGPMLFKLNGISSPLFATSGVGVSYDLGWCNGGDVRKRLLEFKSRPTHDGKYDIQTAVLREELRQNYGTNHDQVEQQYCNEKRVYLEFCATENGEETCATSPVFTLPSKEIQEPHLDFRPPHTLALATGDRPVVTMKTSNWPPGETDGFWNGGGNLNKTYLLWGVAERPNGAVKISAPVSSNQLQFPLSLHDRSVGTADDGALVYLQYAESDCPSNVDTFRSLYSTKLVVDSSVSPLIKQDTKLPDFDTPVYPKTRLGEPVEVTVEATNNGGGRRENGFAVELTYQWYVRISMFEISKTYAEPIPGATGKTLKIKEAICDSDYNKCGRYGCFGLARYYVDVCNTFGCRRSEPIFPDILPPEGKTLADIQCANRA